MGNSLIRKLSLGSVAILLALSVSSPPAFGWGPATHTYLARELGNRYGIMNLQEMYGSVVPDLFNVMFGYEHQEYLWYQAHYEFMKVVDLGKFGRRKAFVYGVAGHNRSWAADYTADDEIHGYVTWKSVVLAPSLQPEIIAFLEANNIPADPL